MGVVSLPDVKRFLRYRDSIVSEVSKAIVGKDDVIELVLNAFLCAGHVLLEDVPGTGKTMLLRAFARAIGGRFSRIQFTPDLLPSDLTGIDFYNQKLSEFEFRPGPVFADIVLADEINRATPRTQSALLEAMEERQVSVDGTTYPLGSRFMVMATQNPLESYGTFPLPEAQTDRFFMRLSLGYMTREQELAVLGRRDTVDIIGEMEKVVSDEDTEYVRKAYREVLVHDDVAGYLMNLVESTRNDMFAAGVSTRGAIQLYHAVQANAALSGRDYALPEDIRRVAPAVLAHRIAAGVGVKRQDAEARLMDLIDRIPVPVEGRL
ncbi:MAG: AAA family ATPase [Clostridiales bacterium]|nr:AAA family ATPase [Clostridiales bacterium]